MEKSKLGISVGLMGAMLYFIGLTGPIPLVVATGYILATENNKWLKRVAIKAIGITLFFEILIGTLRVLENLVVAVANVAGNVGALAGAASVVVSVVALLLAPIDIIQIALFIMAGVLALRQVDMRLGPLDMLANKHLYTREEAGGR